MMKHPMLRITREARGLTQEDVARDLNRSTRTISRWEAAPDGSRLCKQAEDWVNAQADGLFTQVWSDYIPTFRRLWECRLPIRPWLVSRPEEDRPAALVAWTVYCAARELTGEL